MTLTYGSLFSGIGGMDLGFDRAGMECAWQVEIDKQANELLDERFPEAEAFYDIRKAYEELPPTDIIIGGDPCPAHSRARSNGKSKSPDLAGYFLAVVGRLRPRWVVRENVLAPTFSHFDAAMGALGYGTVIIRVDAAPYTGQQRIRDFVIGRYQTSGDVIRGFFPFCKDGSGISAAKLGTRQVAPALTTHRTRYDSRDCYIYESNRLRILDGDERDKLAGFPAGWTAGFSEATRARMCGNAVVPQVAEFIARQIVAVEEGRVTA